MKATPIEIVVKMNRRALAERSKRVDPGEKGDHEKQTDEDQLTGFKDDLLVDVNPQFSAAADSEIPSIGEIPGVNVMKNQDILQNI